MVTQLDRKNKWDLKIWAMSMKLFYNFDYCENTVISFYDKSSDQSIKKNRIYKIIKKNKTPVFCLCDESWNQSMKKIDSTEGILGLTAIWS